MADLLYIKPEGVNGSQVFEDLSANNITLTANGNVQHSITQSKFLTTSIAFDGSGDRITGTLPTIGTSDFTIDFWFMTSTRVHEEGIYRSIVTWDLLSTNNPQIKINGIDGKLCVWWGNAERLKGGAAVDNGAWHHGALVRSADVFYLFLDGAQIATLSASVDFSAATYPALGAHYHSGAWVGHWNGYIDEFRIRDEAVWTASFTPPTTSYWAPYNISGTITGADGNPAARIVRAYNRSTGALIGETTSDASTGAYDLGFSTDDEIQRIVLADETALYNDIIDRVIPG